MDKQSVSMMINGQRYRGEVEPRKTLGDFIRDDAHLTGTHLACEHGVCGACTVLVNGSATRSCLMFAVQADGAEVTTVEGLAPDGGPLNPVQQAFMENHGLQCGFCTPGFVMSIHAFIEENPNAHEMSEDEIREHLSGNICRCTGYHGIVRAAKQAAQVMSKQEVA